MMSIHCQILMLSSLRRLSPVLVGRMWTHLECDHMVGFARVFGHFRTP